MVQNSKNKLTTGKSQVAKPLYQDYEKEASRRGKPLGFEIPDPS